MFSILLLIVTLCGGHAQSSVRTILMEIGQNNPRLKAAAAEMEAEKLEARSEALPANPEVEFNYLWGAENIGGRRDLRVTQSFDIPTITGMKGDKASGIIELSSLKYKTECQAVLLEAQQVCIDLVYWNSVLEEQRGHLEQSVALVDSYKKRLKVGESTVLDLNKAQIHLTSIRGQINRAEAERRVLLSSLRALNGGKEIDFDAITYDIDDTIPDNFEIWFEEASDRSPMIGYVRKQVELENRQVAIDKASVLPELAVGYMSEIRTGEKFRGVTIGVNIPLWSAGNKVRQSKARADAASERRSATEKEFYFYLQSQYTKALSMKDNSEMMRQSLLETDSRGYLFSALSKGEISMVDYLVETDLYYETLEATLDAERDYRHAMAALNAFILPSLAI